MLYAMKNTLNHKLTENGAEAYASTMNAVLDMFAFGAAYRNRDEYDVIELFRSAFEQDANLAVKCLFWIRDVRGGAGERRFFRVAMKWLAEEYPEVALRNLRYVPNYGRFDDLYLFVGTPIEEDALNILALQLREDLHSQFPSLAAKWAKSCNASSPESRRLGELTRKHMGQTQKQYRKMLSHLRERLNVLERLMSGKRFDEIDFEKIPSLAGVRYSHAFATREELKERYAAFMARDDVQVNAATLYPYDCAARAQKLRGKTIGDPERRALNKYWENIPDYTEGKDTGNFMAVCDTSASMTWGNNPLPIDVAVSLAIYFAERAQGPFHNNYISFSSRPRLVEVKGRDFVEKYCRIRDTDLCESTNLQAVFDMLLEIAKSGTVAPEDFVKKLAIISDMEINEATQELGRSWSDTSEVVNRKFMSLMERIRQNWERQTDIPFPQLYYWNVNARNNTILDLGQNVSYVSGASPSILKQILTGKTGWDLCLETLLSERYALVGA